MACAVLGTAIALDVSWRSSLHHTQATLSRTRSELAHTATRLAATGHALSSAQRRLHQLDAGVDSNNQELAVTNQSLSNENGSLFIADLDLNALHTCLAGVGAALTALGASNLPGAVSAITGSSSSCLAVEGGTSSGLAYPYDFPDPYVLSAGGTYYAYATNSAAGNVQVITSSDLTHWSPVGDALPHLPAWAAPGTIWAPSVLQLGSSFVMFYSAGYALSGDQCISEAVATSPEGPFVDTSQFPIVCQLNLGGSIDPSPYIDPGGTLYLDWKSQGAGGQPPTLWAQQLDPSGATLVGTPSALVQPSEPWEDGIVEAPDMFFLDGQRFLFYAGSSWQTDHYAIGVASCSSALGPCTKSSNQPLFASQGDIVGPGGPTAFWNAANTQPDMAFAAWLPNAVGYPHSRVLFIRPLQLVNGVPQICAPAGTTPPTPTTSTTPSTC